MPLAMSLLSHIPTSSSPTSPATVSSSSRTMRMEARREPQQTVSPSPIWPSMVSLVLWPAVLLIYISFVAAEAVRIGLGRMWKLLEARPAPNARTFRLAQLARAEQSRVVSSWLWFKGPHFSLSIFTFVRMYIYTLLDIPCLTASSSMLGSYSESSGKVRHRWTGTKNLFYN